MKNLLLFSFLFISTQTIAQKNQPSLSFGPSFADPLNTAGTEYFKKGIGAGLRVYYPVSKNGSLMANVNYLSFGYKPKYTTSYTLTSFKLGYKTFISNSNFYIYADAGLVVLSSKDATTMYHTSSPTFGFGSGLGYSLPLSKTSFIDFSPSFDYNNAIFGRRLSPELNISYRINLGKK